ncbi:30S ribosome-binding factor RbfA [Halieaceae bacterium IMCC14734]|uniref:Ribosome-binding factor A n=1 Tax=Candidatus Litorirhabdus singularis TaxID=2518993 RepID=A0ABT3TL65_9GAMM|nr:30S ribosome-binding factor RbfA [Candidatus Litorirhabdus singularis]MCX2983050.1 30S ribosome-binding factor RbfA [Candidatus Litorirhabdus singularis]
MAREFQRSDRVSDFLRKELASLLQLELRDPRVGMVSITSVDVSRDLAYARVYCTVLGKDDVEAAEESLAALNKAAGFLRTRLSKGSKMRTVPQLRFLFDSSVGRGAYMEELIGKAVAADSDMDEDTDSQTPEGEV